MQYKAARVERGAERLGAQRGERRVREADHEHGEVAALLRALGGVRAVRAGRRREEAACGAGERKIMQRPEPGRAGEDQRELLGEAAAPGLDEGGQWAGVERAGQRRG